MSSVDQYSIFPYEFQQVSLQTRAEQPAGVR